MKNRYIFMILFMFSFGAINSQLERLSVPPEFTATDINGGEHNLYEYLDQGKIVIIDVGAAWCPPCWAFHQTHILEDAYQMWGPNGTNEIMVLNVEAEPANSIDQIRGISTGNTVATYTEGDWTEGVSYPIIDDAVLGGTTLDVGSYPTIYAMLPNRTVIQIGRQSLASYRAFFDENPGKAVDERDLYVMEYDGTETTCDDATITARVQNLGTKVLTEATFQVLDQGTLIHEYAWTGNLDPYEHDLFLIHDFIGLEGSKTLEIKVVTENGEIREDNNSIEVLVEGTKIEEADIIVRFTTDLYSVETSLVIRDRIGRTVFSHQFTGDPSGGGEDANKTFDFPVTIENGFGCYTLKIIDSFGDGLSGIVEGAELPGVQILNASDMTVIREAQIEDIFFGNFIDRKFEFREASTTSVSKIEGLANIKLFPNPATDLVTVEFDLENRDALQISVINTMGQVVYQNAEIDYTYGQVQEQINVSNFNAGLYFLEVANSNGEKNTLKFNVIK